MKRIVNMVSAAIILLAGTIYGAVIHIPQDYPTIQEGIDSSATGDSVIVASGVYYEHVVVNKMIVLRGENRDNTIIDSSGMPECIRIEHDKATVCYFTVRNCAIDDTSAGIRVIDCDSSLIISCHITRNRNGIFIENALGNYIGSSHIDSNQIGINLTEPSGDENRQIAQNRIYGNFIEYNTQAGIYFGPFTRFEQYLNRIYANSLKGNAIGVDMRAGINNQIGYNDFIDNIGYGASFIPETTSNGNNVFFKNAFQGNHGDSVQAFDFYGNNDWYMYDPFGSSKGNFWSDNPDSGTPYLIGGGLVSDYFPLFHNQGAGLILCCIDNNGNTVSGVTLQLERTGIQGATDQDGLFTFQNLGAGYYNIICTKEGFRDTTVENMVAFANYSYSTLIRLNWVTGIDENNTAMIPNKFQLLPCYPNPFNSSTNIRFNLPNQSDVKIDIYNMLGQKVARLFDNELAAGMHSITFDASGYSSGMYFCRITSSGKSEVQKLQLIK